MKALLIASLICLLLGLAMIARYAKKTNAIQTQKDAIIGENKADEFADEMLTEIKFFFPETPFIYIPQTDMIEVSDGYDGEHDYKFYLGNLRNRAQDMGRKERKTYIHETIMTFTDRSEIAAEELIANLFLRARTENELSLRDILLEKPNGETRLAAVKRGDIILELVMDIPNGVRMVDLETLEKHELSFEKAISIASTNLLGATPDTEHDLWEKVESHIWVSKLNDDYDAVRLFTFPDQMRLPFKGKAYAYTPSHSVLLITDKPDDSIIKEMVKFGNNAAETHRPLSFNIWEQVSKGWQKMTSENKNSAIFRAHLSSLSNAYAEQKNILEQSFEKKDKDIFVASFMAIENKENNEINSLAVFIDGHSYLPVVEYIIPQLGDTKNDDASVKIPWSRFIDVLGSEKLTAVPGLIPKRFEFDGTISPQIRAQLIEAGEPF